MRLAISALGQLEQLLHELDRQLRIKAPRRRRTDTLEDLCLPSDVVQAIALVFTVFAPFVGLKHRFAIYVALADGSRRSRIQRKQSDKRRTSPEFEAAARQQEVDIKRALELQREDPRKYGSKIQAATKVAGERGLDPESTEGRRYVTVLRKLIPKPTSR